MGGAVSACKSLVISNGSGSTQRPTAWLTSPRFSLSFSAQIKEYPYLKALRFNRDLVRIKGTPFRTGAFSQEEA